MTTENLTILATFIVYLAGMLWIGYWAYQRTSSSTDYFLGGRSLGPWPAALSAGASDMSGWLLLGMPGFALGSGLESIWLAGGLLLGTWLNWLIVSRRLRTYSIVANNSLTLPEFFANRFQDKTKLTQTVSAFFILLFFLFYTSSGLVAGGKLFEEVFGLNYQVAVVIGTVCIISYTLFGGFLAVSWTDLVQGLLMAAALIVVPLVVMQDAGGFEASIEAIREKNPELLTLLNNNKGEALSLLAIVNLAAWGLGYFGQPHILARFKAVRSNQDLPTARRIAVSWTFLSLVGATLVGLAGINYLDASGAQLADSEKIFMHLVGAVFHPVVAGILLAAILAAIMSTADSQLLVSSSALAEDFYKALFNKEATQKQVVAVGRIAVIVIAIIALTLAMDKNNSVLDLVSYAWAGFGAAFGPTLILALFWKRMNWQGALAGIVVGGVTVVVWKQLSGDVFELFGLYEIVPGFILATIAIVVTSLATKEPEEEVTKQFNAMENQLYVSGKGNVKSSLAVD
ncbi:sodium/proline symporter PutP [Endozoicomonas sp. SM1973]|uniref:Sodium/proline symporter n=1 Tax=Spartinivicinus marinus TaxID=2994442 RepID=A0A853I8W1_9GAMM|nr:sodium/proline symporter PutP [Spartinivicinus marinus]MCX4025276.1 sodium/proline symporter PutP [Spartinivicinus marinus]NYZ65997.1 sodium/proline symporter PutP [Spartinivicinus marinus]